MVARGTIEVQWLDQDYFIGFVKILHRYNSDGSRLILESFSVKDDQPGIGEDPLGSFAGWFIYPSKRLQLEWVTPV